MPSNLHTSSKSPTIRRILREAAELSSAPSADYAAEPLESDLFEWHFTLRGPPKSPFDQGVYHGRIVLPPSYPLRPPNFRFTTPNGRFETNREICLSISGHHEETWQPAWGIRTAIVALRSFMETDAKGQIGGVETTETVRRRLAKESGNFVCPVCAKSNTNIIDDSASRAREIPSTTDIEVPRELSLKVKGDQASEAEASPSPYIAGEALDKRSVDRFVTSGLSAGSNSVGIESMHDHTAGSVPTPKTTLATSNGDQSRITPPNPSLTQQRRPAPSTQQQPRQQILATGQQRPHNNGVPLLIDYAIVSLAILLLALLLKIMFGV